jgi:hypothetical protein
MHKLDQFKELSTDFAQCADFITIYTEEAHPMDGWGFSDNPNQIKQHRTLEERKLAAQIIADTNPPFNIVLDNMNNEACYKYAAAPERLYAFYENNTVFKGAKGPMDYDVNEVKSWLFQYKNGLLAISPRPRRVRSISFGM